MSNDDYIAYLETLCSASYLVILGMDIAQFDRLLDRLDDAGSGIRPDKNGKIEEYL
jgi:hypothetical protein